MSSTGMPNVSLEVDVDGETKRIDLGHVVHLPRVGDSIECNYVHGVKLFFEVTDVHHHFFNSGHDIVQQITVRGEAR